VAENLAYALMTLTLFYSKELSYMNLNINMHTRVT